MKSSVLIDSWSRIEPDSSSDKRMRDVILACNQASRTKKRSLLTRVQPQNRKWLAAAACLVLAVAVAFAVAIPLVNSGNYYDLRSSRGVKVYQIKNPPSVKAQASLVYFTEEELFANRVIGFELVAFEGTVVQVENIVIDFGGGLKDYRAIATIKVREVFRGDIEAGSTIRVLLPAPVNKPGYWVEDSDTCSQMTVGTTGIFMPLKYDETAYRKENGNTLILTDLAEYGLGDGERWAFLDTPNGLVFDRYAYEGAANMTTLDEIRQYVIYMLS